MQSANLEMTTIIVPWVGCVCLATKPWTLNSFHVHHFCGVVCSSDKPIYHVYCLWKEMIPVHSVRQISKRSLIQQEQTIM